MKTMKKIEYKDISRPPFSDIPADLRFICKIPPMKRNFTDMSIYEDGVNCYWLKYNGDFIAFYDDTLKILFQRVSLFIPIGEKFLLSVSQFRNIMRYRFNIAHDSDINTYLAT